MTFTVRESKNKTSVRRRFMSSCSNEQVRLRMIKKRMFVAIIHSTLSLTPEKKKIAAKIINILILQYICTVLDDYGNLERPIRKSISIHNIHLTFSEQFLRFRQPELHRLFILMRFPITVTLSNRAKMTGEEIF